MSIEIKPVSVEDFILKAKNSNKQPEGDFLAYFRPQIDDAFKFATGPYYWFIGNNAKLKITHASGNIGDLTPHPQAAWENASSFFFAENILEEDRYYVLSALQMAVAKIESLPKDQRGLLRMNIYARMLDKNKKYRWVLIQMPGFYIEEQTGVTCGLMLVTDLSHLKFTGNSTMMTISDKATGKTHYYKIAAAGIELLPDNIPVITKREYEVLRLLVKGLNTPAMVEALHISYHTVENHKRNLRKKTGVKTSAELVHYVLTNNLL